MNPYQILGISPSASDDEVKKAYRTLSKKYHPDANIGNPHQAEYTEKFKEVQNAYKTIMDERKKGFRQQSYGSQTTGGYQYHGNDQEAYQEASGFIQGGRYQEALNVLNQIQNKTGIWFYLAALAENSLGNNIRAQEYAQTAVQMEPMNMQYILLLNHTTSIWHIFIVARAELWVSGVTPAQQAESTLISAFGKSAFRINAFDTTQISVQSPTSSILSKQNLSQ